MFKIENTREKMVNELEQYYEASGFKNVRKIRLDRLTDEEVKNLYQNTMKKLIKKRNNLNFFR